MRSWTTHDETATRALGRRLAEELLPDGILLLRGDFGSGKTVLTRGIAEALAVDAREIQSPTFTLVHEHRGERADLIHVDLYRLAAEDLPELGLEELFERPAVKVVEWAERLPFPVDGARRLDLRRIDESGREIREVEDF